MPFLFFSKSYWRAFSDVPQMSEMRQALAVVLLLIIASYLHCEIPKNCYARVLGPDTEGVIHTIDLSSLARNMYCQYK